MEQKGVIYYLYFDDNPMVGYIGQTRNLTRRLRKHRNSKTRDKKSNWVRKRLSQGFELRHTILCECDIEKLNELEAYYISSYLDSGYSLKNSTSGGDFNYSFTDDVLLKIGQKSRESWQDPEYVENQRERSKKQWQDPEYVEKHRKKAKKQWEDPEFVRKQREQAKKQWEDPEHRAAIVESSCKGFYKVTSPHGEVQVIKNLQKFSLENNLTGMYNVVNGKHKHHKGWTAERLESGAL